MGGGRSGQSITIIHARRSERRSKIIENMDKKPLGGGKGQKDLAAGRILG